MCLFDEYLSFHVKIKYMRYTSLNLIEGVITSMLLVLEMLRAVLLCISWMYLYNTIDTHEGKKGVLAQVIVVIILAIVRVVLPITFTEPIISVVLAAVGVLCMGLVTRSTHYSILVKVLITYLIAKFLSLFCMVIVVFVTGVLLGVQDEILRLILRYVIHLAILPLFMLFATKIKFELTIRNHTILVLSVTSVIFVLLVKKLYTPYDDIAISEEILKIILVVLGCLSIALVFTVIFDNKDGKKERKLITEQEQAHAGRRAAEAAHKAAVKVSHDIKEDLQKHLREYRMEAASDAAPELPGRVVARTYRDMERRTSQELRDGKRLHRTGIPALDARLMRSLALAHELDVDLDLMALAPIGGAVGRGVTADALAEAVGGVVDGAARAAAACDNPVRRVLLTVDMAGGLFPSIRIESTGAQFPEPDILEAVSQLLLPRRREH